MPARSISSLLMPWFIVLPGHLHASTRYQLYDMNSPYLLSGTTCTGLPATSPYWKMIQNTHVILCFLRGQEFPFLPLGLSGLRGIVVACVCPSDLHHVVGLFILKDVRQSLEYPCALRVLRTSPLGFLGSLVIQSLGICCLRMMGISVK